MIGNGSYEKKVEYARDPFSLLPSLVKTEERHEQLLMNFEKIHISCMMFDLDGTLIDSVPAYIQLMISLFEFLDIPPPPKSLVAEFMNHGFVVFEKLLPEGMKEKKDKIIEEIMTRGRQMSKDMFQNQIKVIPGVEQLFSLLAERKIKIAVVSSTEKKYLEKKLQPLARAGIRDALDVVIGIEDAPRRKPAPDPLIVCAQRLSVSPERCIYVGDSHIDIQAGNAAGMMTIGVLTGLGDREGLMDQKPSMVIPSVDDIRFLLR